MHWLVLFCVHFACLGVFEFGLVRTRSKEERWAWRWGYLGGCCAGVFIMCLGMVLAKSF